MKKFQSENARVADSMQDLEDVVGSWYQWSSTTTREKNKCQTMKAIMFCSMFFFNIPRGGEEEIKFSCTFAAEFGVRGALGEAI